MVLLIFFPWSYVLGYFCFISIRYKTWVRSLWTSFIFFCFRLCIVLYYEFKNYNFASFLALQMSVIPLLYALYLIILVIVLIFLKWVSFIFVFAFSTLKSSNLFIILEYLHTFTHVNQEDELLLINPFTDDIQSSFSQFTNVFEYIHKFEPTFGTSGYSNPLLLMNGSESTNNLNPDGVPSSNGSSNGLPRPGGGWSFEGIANTNSNSNESGQFNDLPSLMPDQSKDRCVSDGCECFENYSCVCLENNVDHTISIVEGDPSRKCCYCGTELSGDMRTCSACDCRFCATEVDSDSSYMVGNEPYGGHDSCSVAHTNPEGSVDCGEFWRENFMNANSPRPGSIDNVTVGDGISNPDGGNSSSSNTNNN